MRITVYAEGSRETGAPTLTLSPGSVLPEGSIGPVHELVRRCVMDMNRGAPVTFLSPLRDSRGRRVQGSQLLHRTTLRRLLRWPNSEFRPDLALVIVDEDGVEGRLQALRSSIEDIQLPIVVIAVAVREFEAWLIADHVAAQKVLGVELAMSKDPEAMVPGEAKHILARWFAEAGRADTVAERRALVRATDLQTVRKRCSSFAALNKELRAPSA